jgi:phage tail-like protein
MAGAGGQRIDPIGVSSFWMEWGHDQIATFQEVSGIESETEVRELIQSGKDGKIVVIKTQGAAPLKTGKITAKYAAVKDDVIAKWREQVIAGKIEAARKNISIVLYDIRDIEQLRFEFLQAWPSKYSYSNFSAKGNDNVTITVVIEHEGIKVTGYNSGS